MRGHVAQQQVSAISLALHLTDDSLPKSQTSDMSLHLIQLGKARFRKGKWWIQMMKRDVKAMGLITDSELHSWLQQY